MLPILLLLAAAADGPLVSPVPALDRGEVRTGPPLVFAFEVLNAGGGLLTVRGVDTGCNCATPEVSANTLAPGQRATVTVRVNTLTPSAGANRWRIGVCYRTSEVEPDRTLELTAAATLVREVAVTPPGVAVSTAGTVTLPLTVTDRRGKPLTVTGATATSPHLTATVAAGAVGPDGVWSQAVALTVGVGLPPGRHAETLVLATTDPTMPELRVPVTVDKRSPQEVRAYPPVATAAGGSATVQLRRAGNKSLAVAAVESDHPAVTATAEGSGPTLTLRVAVGTAAGTTGEAVLRVRLSDPAGHTLTVPVRWGRP